VNSSVESIGRVVLIDLAEDGAFIRLPVPFEQKLAADFRKRFRLASWSCQNFGWRVTGTQAAKNLRKWAHGILEVDCAAAAGVSFDPGAALQERWNELADLPVIIRGGVVTCRFRYDAAAVDIARSMPNRVYDFEENTWSWSVNSIAQVDTVINGLKAIDAIMSRFRFAGYQIYNRYLIPADLPINVGELHKGDFKPFAVIAWSHLGPVFDHPTGPSRYAYYRNATDDEFLTFDAWEPGFRNSVTIPQILLAMEPPEPVAALGVVKKHPAFAKSNATDW
jgi:hypothetical protein